MKTSDLIGHTLDWAVAKCEGVRVSALQPHGKLEVHFSVENGGDIYDPSANWSQGGPIIEREKINLLNDRQDDLSVEWVAHIDDIYVGCGPTPLIAAMRCYVAFRLGDEVDIPLEFL